ncbi:MAG: asparagine synthetase B [Patescibacteria group bacterium]
MCGIYGVVGPDVHTGRMGALLAHRGPDGENETAVSGATLGHRLLSIRDTPQVSGQPVTRAGSPWMLSFNGQLYNTATLALHESIPYADLDTTMLFELIIRRGWEFVSHIEGMFAIALYNTESHELRLYRDASGQKPLYYMRVDGTVRFASEIKALIDASDKRVDTLGLAVAETIGFIPGGRTLISGIMKVPPGACVHITQNEMHTESFAAGETEYEGEPREVMRTCIREHLLGREQVVINLSGGMDSSLLAYEMKELGFKVITYTTRFDIDSPRFNDDADLAQKLARDLGTDHREILITKREYMNRLECSLAAVEEPNYNVSIPTYLALAEREGANGDGWRVVLSGDGGDEIFGGYDQYKSHQRHAEKAQRFGFLYNAALALRSGRYTDFSDPAARWLYHKRFRGTPPDTRVLPYLRAERERWAAKNASPRTDAVYQGMVSDRALWLAGENFIRSDKIFMTQSVELRSPLAYPPLRRYFDARLSATDYFKGSFNKVALRALYRGALPSYITDREAKTGWRSPVSLWYDASMKRTFLDILSDAPNILDWNNVRSVVEKTDRWPSKEIHVYLSLAALAKKFSLT